MNKCPCCKGDFYRYEKCRKLRSRYGITLATREEMVFKQGGKCALCNGRPSKLDHCHKTGRVRGVICDKCNVWLAPLDDYKWMVKAASYLMPPKD